MSFINGPVFTSAGKALHARAVAGATLTFTKMQLGDGSRGTATIESLTRLISPVASVGISNIRTIGNATFVTGIFSNEELSAGFNWTEIGLFAADPDNPNDRSKDILYCYQNAAGSPDYIPASNSSLITKRISIVAITDNAANVSAVINGIEKAEDVTFSNEGTELESANVQAAIEELSLKMKTAGNADERITAHNKDASAHNDIRVSASNAASAAATAQSTANNHIANKSNPHGVTAEQVGARPSSWMPTAADVGAISKDGDTINDDLILSKLGRVSGQTGMVILGAYSSTKSTAEERQFVILNKNTVTKPENALRFRWYATDGTFTDKTILHTGNKDQIFTYGTDDLTAGASSLETGKLYFVYE